MNIGENQPKTIETLIGERRNPPESSPSPSKRVYKINGKEIDPARFDAVRFWKNEFVKSMREVSPHFRIDESNRALMHALFEYAWRLKSSILDLDKGLLLWGGLGVGKSTLLKGMRLFETKINRYSFASDNPHLGFTLVSAAELSLRYAEKGVDAISDYAQKLNLAIDEVGREPMDSKHYGTGVNPVQLVLQLRYEHRYDGRTHLTTNLDPDTQFGIYGDYVVDRVKEMFNVIHIRGTSRR